MKKIVLIAIFVLLGSFCWSQCPTYGTAKNANDKRRNELKNRAIDTSKKATFVPISRFLKTGNDTARFSDTMYVYTEAYLVDYKMGDPESCNCKSDSSINWDFHLELGSRVNSASKNCMVAEITPLGKKAMGMKSIRQLAKYKGKKVRIYGYLLFDDEHEKNSVNTCKTCTHVYRKTAWEIHPVTKIELVK